MTDAPRQTDNTASRVPDCVTELRKGNTTLIVSGYFKLRATETVADKMAKAIETEAATGLSSFMKDSVHPGEQAG